MADSNYTEKRLLEKIQDLLERKPETCDVAFFVGKEKKIVRALKVILKASSPFLEKEFKEKWEVAGFKKRNGIPLPDFDPIAFELFVKLTSLDTWSLEILKALNLPLNQILNLLSICRRFEMKMAEENLKILSTIFLQSFGKYKDTDDFLQLSQTNLKSVLASDDIKINELAVFYAAIRWADFQCRQMEVLPTEVQLRKVLGDCLIEIRFPIMTCAEFTEARESKEIFTAEEIIGIYTFIGLTGNEIRKRLKLDSKMVPFKTTPRIKVRTLEFKRNSETNSSGSLIPAEISRLGSTWGLESAINHPNVINDTVHAFNVLKENEAPFSVDTLKDEIRWGKKISGFPPRSQHAAVAIDNAIYSFGGINENGHPSYSRDGPMEVFVLNVNERKKKWKKLSIEISEVNPIQRYGHSAVAHKEFVIIFGGYVAKDEKWSNSTHRLNTQTLKWDKPKVSGNIPAARYHRPAVVLRNKMFVYGGRGDEATNDLHSLDLESFRWSKIKTKGIPPSVCYGHSATVHNDRFILIFGGFDREENKKMNTIWSFDLNDKTWTAVETRGTPTSSQSHHCAFVHNGRMYIFGGFYYDKKAKYLNDLFSYDPETFEWKKVTPNGGAPSPRTHAGCVSLNDQVFIFGGNYLEFCDDTFVLQM